MSITSRCAICNYVDPQLQITVSAKIAFADAYYGFMLKRHIWTIQKALTRGCTTALAQRTRQTRFVSLPRRRQLLPAAYLQFKFRSAFVSLGNFRASLKIFTSCEFSPPLAVNFDL